MSTCIVVIEDEEARRKHKMETETTSTVPIVDHGETSFDADPLQVEMNPDVVAIAVTAAVTDATETLVDECDIRRSAANIIESPSGNSAPFIGNVYEDTTVSSSWIFPTAALTSSKALISDDISFVPPLDAEETSSSLALVPLDGSFHGDPNAMKIFRTDSREKDLDISFQPPILDTTDEIPTPCPVFPIQVPQDGSFIMDRKLRIGHSSSSESRDIDFAPAGSGMETASPPLQGCYGKSTVRDAKPSHHDIDVVPDLAGKDMPTSPPPKQGTFWGQNHDNVPVNAHVMSSKQRDDREVNFSPGASEMDTSPPTCRGSYIHDRNVSPMRGALVHQEINVLPDNIGKDMFLSPAPQQGGFLVKLNGEGGSRFPQPTCKEMPLLSPPKGGDILEQNDDRECPTFPLRDSWVFPQLHCAEDRDINFSPGASGMETAAPPCLGSYLEGPHTSPPRGFSAQQEINVIPDLTGKFMPTSPPPNQGSFFRKHEETNKIDTAENEGISQSVVPNYSTRHANEDINFCPEGSSPELMEHIPQPGHFSLRGPDEKNKFFARRNSDEKYHEKDEDDDNDDDPIEGDQELWKSKKLWELAKLKQKTKSANKMAEDKATEQSSLDDCDGETIIPEECSESNPLAESMQKVGALLGSANDIRAVDSIDEVTDLSSSIQKIGALLGSAYVDDALHNQSASGKEGTPSFLRVQRLQDEIMQPTTSDLLDDLLGEDEGSTEEGETSHSESIVDLSSLPEFNSRFDIKVQDDDITVHIGNTTKQIQGKKGQEREHVQVDLIVKEETFIDDALDIAEQDLPNKRVEAVDYIPDDSMAKLEALLDDALDAPFEGCSSPSENAQKFIENVKASPESEEDYIPNDSIAKLEALLDEALKDPLETPRENTPRNAGDETKDTYCTAESFVPDDTIATLEASLDAALDAPMETNDNEHNCKLKQGLDKDRDVMDDSISALDHFLENMLGDEVEITFEPTEEEIEAPAKDVRSAVAPRVSSQPKAVASRNRFTKVAGATEVNSNVRKQTSRPKQPQDHPTSRNPSMPRFRGPKKVSKEDDIKAKAPRIKNGPMSQGQGKHDASRSNKSASFISSALGVRTKRESDDSKKEHEEGVTRTRKIMSRFTHWTKRGTKAKAACQDSTPNKTDVPTFTPAESRNKGRTAPVRLFTSRNSSSRKMDDDESLRSLSIGSFRSINAIDQQSMSQTKMGGRTHRIELTGMQSVPKHSDFYALSPLAQSISSLSSTCSVTSFRSPRREGVRGCQNKFNPYLHDIRGPCELCVFFLSEEEKAALNLNGRHVRVMFTTGGCCQSCQIFPRSFDDLPARLCRMCYSNSHRKVHERFSTKRGRRLVAHDSLNQG